ncbi:MAG: nitroreductase [Oscillibacter sp.]|jgi:hypothetical protein|nr:nitroreductase [Oscillibacter sp.]
MTIMEAIKARHAVRSFTDRKIDSETRTALIAVIDECNAESGLHIQLICDEPKAFDGMMAHYGNFKNCCNYLAIAGRPGSDEAVGYYGEKAVLTAQALGLNSCWVAMSYSKSKVPCKLSSGEKLQIVIALGYGETQGIPHKSKSMGALCRTDDSMTAWFKAGMEAALLAPTALNQQKFCFTLKDGVVSAKAGLGFYAKMDLGIVKYHFELGAGKDHFKWA